MCREEIEEEWRQPRDPSMKTTVEPDSLKGRKGKGNADIWQLRSDVTQKEGDRSEMKTVLYIHKSRWREGMREGRQVEIKVIKGNNYHIQMRRKLRNKIEQNKQNENRDSCDIQECRQN